MSSYGTALAVDCPNVFAPGVASTLAELAAGASVHVSPGHRGWSRVSGYLGAIELVPTVGQLLAAAGEGRAAIAEDLDEFGACWTVLACSRSVVTVVHRRYVLNADPDEPEQVRAALLDLEHDPRAADVDGAAAAAEAARVFDVDPAAMVAAEASSGSAWEEIGVVGGPFPWWDALGLTWPVA